MTRRVLVTGAGGFVGTNLVLALARQGDEVTGVVRPGGTTWRTSAWEDVGTVRPIDLRDPVAVERLVQEVRPEVIFHLATVRDEQRPADLVDLNVGSVASLISGASRAGVRRIVHAGSSTEYGDVPRPYDEDGPRNPTSWYGASRAVASDLMLAADRRRDVETCVLRLFHVHGPWESPKRLVPRAIVAAHGGSPLALTPIGFVHDLVHVDDVVTSMLRASTVDEVTGHVINVCTGVPSDNHEVVAAVARATGRPIERAVGGFRPRHWDRSDWYGRVGRMTTQLGVVPQSLADGLDRTLAWWGQHRHRMPA